MAKGLRWLVASLTIVLLAAGMSLAGSYLPKVNTKTDTGATSQTPASEPPKPVEAPKPEPAPVPTPAPAPDRTAVTNSFVRLRAGKSTSTNVLAELQGGTKVILLDDSDQLWQQVKYNDLTGYIYKSYLTY